MMQYIGSLELPNKVSVTDPCYDEGTWGRVDNVEITPGTYELSVKISDLGVWGKRISRLIAVHSEHKDKELNQTEIGVAGVDAGLCGIFSNKPDFDDDAWKKLCDTMFAKEETSISTNTPNVYVYNEEEWKGFWSESGCGDGVYPVFMYTDKDKPVGLEIRFI